MVEYFGIKGADIIEGVNKYELTKINNEAGSLLNVGDFKLPENPLYSAYGTEK